MTDRRRVGALAIGAVALSLLGACGEPPWQQTDPSSAVTSTDPAAPSQSTGPDPTSTATQGLTGIVNDLASGTAERSMAAGAATIDVTYWSDLDMTGWTATASKPVSLSATATVDGDVAVYLARLRVVTVVRDAAGELLSAPAEFVDSASVQPGYTMTDPYSYATTVIVPALDEDAASVELTFVYEVLIATTPTDTAFAKQTATDTLVVALATG